MSAGAGAGIAIGGMVVVLILAGLIWLPLRRRKRRSTDRGNYNQESNIVDFHFQSADDKKSEPYEMPEASLPYELEGSPRAELDSGWQAPEADPKVKTGSL